MLPFTSCSESREHVGPDDTRAQVTIGTLLDEMTDRDAVARYPELEYRSASFSSYDRNSTSKDGDWFANGDNNWFLRHEKVSNRQEFVLFEADGPGAVTRWWMTFAGVKGGQGYLRVYIDGADTPVIAGTPFQILSGNNVPDVLAEHEQLLHLIESGNTTDLEPLLRRHLYGGIRRIGPRIYTTYVDYFEPFGGDERAAFKET